MQKTVKLTKEEVESITCNDVHDVIKKNMLIRGYDLVIDFDKSHDLWIHDKITGEEYLDMFSFFASFPISHNHPKLTEKKFKEKIGNLAIHNPSNSNVYSIELAQFVATFERVCMPDEFKHLFLIAGGTLAVENALKTAFDWKVRKNLKKGVTGKGHKVIHFKEAFHGRSGYSLSLTNTDPAKYMHFPVFNWPRVLNPKATFPLEGKNLNDTIELEEKAKNHIRELLEQDSDDIACIIIEPIQGEGGDHHFRPEFWEALRKLSNDYNVLLIADEIQTGVGITGKMWCYEHLGVSPDIVCFGKKTQVCGIMCTNKIDDIDDNVFKTYSRINSTWGGNLVDMVRSRKMLEIIEEENLVENSRIMGNYLLDELNKLKNKFPNYISNVRGKGLMCAFDLPSQKYCNELKKLAYENKLLLITCGLNSIRFRPVLDIKKNDISKLINILEICLNKFN